MRVIRIPCRSERAISFPSIVIPRFGARGSLELNTTWSPVSVAAEAGWRRPSSIRFPATRTRSFSFQNSIAYWLRSIVQFVISTSVAPPATSIAM